MIWQDDLCLDFERMTLANLCNCGIGKCYGLFVYEQPPPILGYERKEVRSSFYPETAVAHLALLGMLGRASLDPTYGS